MAIIANEIKRYKATTNNDTTSNGGRMSTNLIVSGVRNAVFPNVGDTERTSGVTRWRKIFIKIANDDDLTFYNSKVHMTKTSNADDYFSICEGGHDDVYSDLSSPRMYGVGVLESAVTAGDSEITVTIENTAMAIFNTSSADNVIWIGDGTNNEYFENVSASKTDTTVTLTLNTGDVLANSYSTSDTYVASCIDTGDIAANFNSVDITSIAGTFDSSTYPIVLDNIGTVYDEWTLEFTNATTYTITGANEGLLSSGGNTSGNASPINSNFAKKYMTIDYRAFGGNYVAGDTIEFTTYPAAISIWYKEVVPAGAVSAANNTWSERIIGESA